MKNRKGEEIWALKSFRDHSFVGMEAWRDRGDCKEVREQVKRK